MGKKFMSDMKNRSTNIVLITTSSIVSCRQQIIVLRQTVSDNATLDGKVEEGRSPLCFHDFMPGNVIGMRSLPLVPFRTDSW